MESKSLQSRNAHFLWFLLFIEVLVQTHHSPDAKKDLVNVCKKIIEHEPNELATIELFEREYVSEKAIWWYTLDSCLYRLLNSALRSRDFDILFAFRFFISDLAHVIEYQYKQFLRLSTNRDPIEVYRGQNISDSELKLILENVNEFISMNSFFSTSRQRQVAVEFLQSCQSKSTYQRVLYEITIDPRLPMKPFADIRKHSVFDTEEEVLITLGALYRIDKITEDPDEGFHAVQLSLANETDYRLKNMYDYLRQTINYEYTLDSLGKILHEMGEYQHALKYYDRMMRETQIVLANCHMGIGRAMYGITSYDNALKHYEASLSIRKNELGENCPAIGISYGRVGAALCRQGEMRRSLECLDRARKIQELTLPSNSIELAETYNTVGLAHFTLDNLQQAADCFQKVLDIRLQILPDDHSAIGFAHNNLSQVLQKDRNYEQALVHAKQALLISLKTLARNHPDVERIEENIRGMINIRNAQKTTTSSKDELEYLLLSSLGTN